MEHSTPPTTHGEAVVHVDATGVIVQASDELRSLLGWPADLVVGRSLLSLIPQRFRAAHQRGFNHFVETGDLPLTGRALRLPALRPDGVEVDVELILSAAADAGAALVIGTLREPEQTLPATQFELSRTLARALASGEPLPVLLEKCLAVVGRHLGWSGGAVWVVDPFTDHLYAAAVWESVPGALAAYVEESSSISLDLVESLPGLVLSSGDTLWVSDLAHDPRIGRRRSAVQDRLDTGLFFPLLGEAGPVGVVELVDDQRRGLTIEIQEAVRLLAEELGRLVAQRILREIEATERNWVALALSARQMGVWTYHQATGTVRWDEQMERLYGFAPGEFGGTFDAYAARIHPDDRAAAKDEIAEAIKHRHRFDYQYRIQTPHGRTVWIQGAGQPLIDSDGALRGLTGISFDVTDQVEDRLRLEESARHANLLAEVGQAFVSTSDIATKLRRTTEAVVDNLDVAFARIWTVSSAGAELVLRASAGHYTHLDGAHARIRIGERKIGRIAAERRPLFTNDVVGDPQIADQDWARREGMRAFAGHPLVVRDRVVGVLALFSRNVVSAEARAAVAAVADLVSIGIEQSDNAAEVLSLLASQRRHTEERAQVARVLQASLLPPSLPDIPGLEIHARYRAGIEEVGGDFYDLLPLGGPRWAFMIGDICGQGPEAARLTALARHSLRTALMMGHSPTEALAALNAALLQSDNDDRFCTAVCGTLTVGANDVQISVCVGGHPAPIVVHRDGSCTEIAPTGPLAGILRTPTFTQTDLTLGRAETLVLYTDGLTESRQGAEHFGDRRLRNLLSTLAGCDARSIGDRLVEAATAYDRSVKPDDLALLIIRVDPLLDPGVRAPAPRRRRSAR